MYATVGWYDCFGVAEELTRYHMERTPSAVGLPQHLHHFTAELWGNMGNNQAGFVHL